MMQEIAVEVLGNITPIAVAYLALGIVLGVILGAIPGLSGTIGLAVAIPFTAPLGLFPAIALLTGIYKGSMFGGAIAAISFGVPGTPSSAPTVFDGHELTKQGRPRAALSTAHYSGVAADFFSDIVLVLVFAPLAAFALNFGPRELFALLTVAMGLLVIFVADSVPKGLVAIGIGSFLASIGPDPISGVGRFTFGLTSLRDGIGLVPLLVGLFAVPEIMRHFANRMQHLQVVVDTGSKLELEGEHLKIRTWLRESWRETAFGATVGTIVGAIPGPGATLASFTSYGVASRWRRNQDRFGKGAVQGVAAAEAADSATAGSTLVPLFGLGIPGSAMAALFGAALALQGISAGPLFVQNRPGIAYSLFAYLFIGSAILFVVVHYLMPLFAHVASLPPGTLAPIIGVMAVLGVYSINVNPRDVWIALIAGYIGFYLRNYGVPLGGIVLAFIVSPIFEASLRRALIIARGDYFYLFDSSLALTLYALGALTAAALLRLSRRHSHNDFSQLTS